MSQISGPGISITFAANADQVVTESSRVRAEVTSVGNAAVKSFDSASVSARGLGRSLSALTRAAGLFGAVLAAAGGIVNIIDSIGSRAEKNKKALDDLTKSARDFAQVQVLMARGSADEEGAIQKANRARREAQKQIEELAGAAEAQLTSVKNAFLRQFGLAPSREEIIRSAKDAEFAINQAAAAADAEAKKREKVAAERAAKTKADAERDASLRAAESVEKEAAAIRRRLLPELEREEAEAIARLAELEARLNRANTNEERRALLQLYGAVADEFSARKKEIAEQERRDQERLLEERRRFEESLQEAQRAQNERVAQSIQSAAEAMRDAARQLTDMVTDVSGIRNVVETRIAIGGGRR